VCLACIRERPAEAMPLALAAHARARSDHGFPAQAPRDPEGVACSLCVHECRIPEGGTGWCGVRGNTGGALTGATPAEGKLSWYHDPLPTNCVADWVCAGGTGAGYPRFAHCPGPERGFRNLAVFFHACSFDCLFCQNWQYRLETGTPRTTPVAALVDDADESTACICYFGGDPAPQLPFSIRAARLARDRRKGSILRLCWETNGSMQERLLDEIVDLAIESGGCVKFDLKARDDALHVALTGVTNLRTLDNFSRAAGAIPRRPAPPPLVASTLMVPGYVDEEEVGKIAGFIASLDGAIPYSLLAFHPHFRMADLPRTPGSLARGCLRAARDAGLTRVRMGNVHLLA
jgi:pyruvate formate lyase activating enzyme